MFLKCYKTPDCSLDNKTRFCLDTKKFQKVSTGTTTIPHFVVIFDGTLDSGPVVTFCYSNI